MGYFDFLSQVAPAAKKKRDPLPGEQEFVGPTEEVAGPTLEQAGLPPEMGRGQPVAPSPTPVEAGRTIDIDFSSSLEEERQAKGLMRSWLRVTGDQPDAKRVISAIAGNLENGQTYSLEQALDDFQTLSEKYKGSVALVKPTVSDVVGKLQLALKRKQFVTQRMAAIGPEGVQQAADEFEKRAAAIRGQHPPGAGVLKTDKANETASILEGRTGELREFAAKSFLAGPAAKPGTYPDAQRVAREAELATKLTLAGQGQPSSADNIEHAFRGARLTMDDWADGMLEWKLKYGIDFDRPVGFLPGMQQALKDEFPELIPVMAAEAARIASVGGPMATATAAAGGMAKQGQKFGKQAADKAAELSTAPEKAALDEKHAQLAQAQEMQSWPSIISYILLSFVLGPRLAFLFFSNAIQKGTLKRQIEDIKDRVKHKEARAKEERDRQEWNRRFAAQFNMRRQLAKESRYDEFRKQYIMTRQRAKTMSEQDKSDPLIINLTNSFNRATKLGAAASQMGDLKRAKEFLDDANEADTRILERLDQLNKERRAGVKVGP